MKSKPRSQRLSRGKVSPGRPTFSFLQDPEKNNGTGIMVRRGCPFQVSKDNFIRQGMGNIREASAIECSYMQTD